MRNNCYIAVIYTEYQLLQVQSLVSANNINNCILINMNSSRVQDEIIDKELFKSIITIPSLYSFGSTKRLSNKYINDSISIINNYLKAYIGSDCVLIGAQDENTDYSILKNVLTPNELWSIEDGLANYYQRGILFRTSIFFKNMLFKYIYFKNIDVKYRHGQGNYIRIYRMDPELAIDKYRKIDISNIINKYIKGYSKYLQHIINNNIYEKYLEKKILSVGFNENLLNIKNDFKYWLVKMHPNENHTGKCNDFDIFNYKIPLEVLLYLYPNIRFVVFNNLSTSLLNIIKIKNNVKIIINFKVNRLHKNFFNKLYKKYNNRFIDLEYIRNL